ncbi:MAG TPA: DUF1508 domain-containing protein [Acidimicrobiia bacterium]|jgi:uncharacterized protein YegP (UPF0339 family)|nr:DUF1508 domain-containing protein [Acidimicrobiia bacterium]
MAAKFEILSPKTGQYRWVLSNQGRVLAESDSYTRKASCMNALESFRKAAPIAAVVDTTTATVVKSPRPRSVPGRAARVTGRALGKVAATVKKVV